MDDFTINIAIPTDNEDFVSLKCPKCGECFKLSPGDIESEDIIEIYCPQCGLSSENYITEELFEKAKAKVLNHVIDGFYNEMKKVERRTNNSMIKVKTNKLKKEYEPSVRSTIDSMEIIGFECCNRQANIRHLLKICGCYCPYCGGLKDGNF